LFAGFYEEEMLTIGAHVKLCREAKSQAKLIHGMQLVLARNYIENLREEVKKGMREKAEQGLYPGRARSATATTRRSGRSKSTLPMRRS
jgi:DNA invertase Pin-like site-specific DNA recombinase